MSSTRWVSGGFLILILGATQLAAQNVPAWGNAQLTFEANTGQVAREVRYLARGNGYGVFLTDEEMTLGFAEPGKEPARMRPVGRNRNAWFEALDPQPGASHYFRGTDNGQALRAPRFGRIRNNGVWNGIDMMYHIAGRQLEYDFIVAPGARVSDIRLDFVGGDLSIDDDGNLIMRMNGSSVRHQHPVAYQEKRDGSRQPVAVRFRKLGDRRIGFEVGAYDGKHALVIDPKLDYSTYWGGGTNTTQGELGWGITVDAQGYTYVTGVTAAIDFPMAAPVQGAIGGDTDAFVVKISPDGMNVVTSTYIGGSAGDEGHDIKVDWDGNIYITGYTDSANFPIVNGFQKTKGGSRDAFLTKLNTDGSAILYSTFLGGSGEDRAYGLAVSPEGDAYLTGATQSNNFPVKNAMQPTRGGGMNDAFITKVDRDGTLAYSTFLGGFGVDLAYDITLGPDGSAYVTGTTTSFNFPLRNDNAGPTQFIGNPDDAFVTRVGPSGNLILSVLLGGSASDEAVGIALDANQDIYITGYTASVDYPTWNALQPFLSGAADIFITRIRGDGSLIEFSTFWGSTESEGGVGIAVDTQGFVVVTGFTGSFAFPLINALQDRLNLGTPDLSRDGFLLKINGAGSAVVYSTYLGGRGNDGALGMALDSAGNAYITGFTASAVLPLANALQPQLADSQDAFILKFNAQDVVGTIETQVPALGLSRISLGGLQRTALFGYADVALPEGAPRPAGMEIVRVQQLDRTVSEVGLPLTPPLRYARLFVENMSGSMQESIAIVNPGDEEVTLTYYFSWTTTGEDGQDQVSSSEPGSINFPPKNQLFVLLTGYPFNLPQGLEGTLTLESTAPLAITAVRAQVNSSSNLILSRIPIHDRSAAEGRPEIIDHFVDGGGWTTQVVLVNHTEGELTGHFQFFGPGNAPATAPIDMTMSHATGVTFPYRIPARGAIRVGTTGAGGEGLLTGFIKITPDPGYVTPSSFSFLEHSDDTSATLEAQVVGDRFRAYVESSPAGSGQLARRFALGMTNSSEAPVTVLLEARNADGTSTGISAPLTMPSGTQISRFLDEIPGLEAMPETFRGLLGVTVIDGPGVTVTGVQSVINESNNFLITTTGPVREDTTAATPLVFPYIPTGAQYTTSVILFGPANGGGLSGTVRTWDSQGTPLFLVLQ